MKQLLITIAALVLVGCGPQPPDLSIHEAVINRDIEAVKQHLAAGTNVDEKDGVGWTPLHYAAVEGNKEVVELLITKGADVNAKDDQSGMTPLHGAAFPGHKEIVELLITEGADVNAKNGDESTPLHQAAYWGHKEIAELLIAAGADVNAKGNIGVTPLDIADGETADLLRKHGGKTAEELKAAGD